MVLQLEGSDDDSFSIYVNGTTLSFLIREFVLVAGLNCVGNPEDFQCNTKVPNRIVDTYFGGAKNVKKKNLLKCFDDKNWGHDNDGDAVIIAVLYFIYSFIFSTEKNTFTIPRKHFDLVESERYFDYPWGKDAFQNLFYECCSNVDPKIARQVDNRIPRILNWKFTVNQPTYSYLMNDMFNDQENMIVYSDIQLSDIELAIIQIPPEGVDVVNNPTHSNNNEDDSDDFSHTPLLQPKKKHDASVGPSSSPPHKKRKYQLIDPSTVESSIPHVLAIPQSKTPPVMGEFTSLRTLIDENFKSFPTSLKPIRIQKGYTRERNISGDMMMVMQRKMNIDIHSNQYPHAISTGDTLNASTEVNLVCGEVIMEGNTTFEVMCIIPHTSDEGISSEVHVSQFELANEFLPSQIPETRIMIHHAPKTVDSTPLPSHRNWHPSRWTLRDKLRLRRYTDTDSNASVTKEEDVVCNYIRGYRFLANVPWHTVDNVLIPVNLKDKLHWILAVVSFKERCIKRNGLRVREGLVEEDGDLAFVFVRKTPR
uniref:Uncharacterized protein LOC104245845 n=1 Tax=Nicotiana sylvestris TaxID=4096 RepID=A0A1U7Y9Q8_NICSY|nr:PREDICTED: uncharacterized protein LOC104245845 [Nicotiana sylvestris]